MPEMFEIYWEYVIASMLEAEEKAEEKAEEEAEMQRILQEIESW